MRTLAVILAICAVANGQFPGIFPTIKLPIGGFPTIKLPTVKFEIPTVPSFIPGYGKKKDCPKTLSGVNYINCCGPQGTCDATKIGKDLTPDKLGQVSCSALGKGISSQGQLKKLIPGLTSKSSPCLTSVIAQSFLKFNGAISKWNQSLFDSLPDDALSSFDISSLKGIPSSFFKSKSSLKKLGRSMRKMTTGQISSMLPGLKSALGSIHTWNDTTVKNLLTSAPSYLCGMSTTDASQLNASAIAGSISQVASAVRGCSSIAHAKNLARSFIKTIIKLQGDVAGWNGTVLNNLAALKSQLTVPQLLSLTEAALSDPKTLMKYDTILSATQKQAIADALGDLVLGNATGNATIANLLIRISTVLTSLPSSSIDKLNCTDVGSYLLKSASKDISAQSLQRVMQRAKACGYDTVMSTSGATFSGAMTASSFTSDDITSMAPYLAGFSTPDIDMMDLKSAFQASSSTLNTQISGALSKVQGRKVLSKVLTGASRLDLEDASSVGKFLTAKDISEAAKGFTLDDIKDATEDGLSVAKDASSEFAKIALKNLGTNFADAEKFPSNTIFSDLGHNVVRGFNRTTFRNLPLNGLDGFASSASKYALTAGQTIEMAKRFSSDFVSSFTEQTVRGLGPVVLQWNSSVLDALPTAAKAQAARNFGQYKKLIGFAGRKSNIEALAMKALQWLNATGRTLTNGDIQGLGTLVHFLKSSYLEAMNSVDLEASVNQLSESSLGETAEDAKSRLTGIAQLVHRKLKDSSSGLKADVVKSLGQATCYLPDSFFSSLTTKAKFDDVFETLGSAGCTAVSTSSKMLVSKAKQFYTAGSNNVSKMPRQILRTLNKSLPAMSSADIAALPTSVVKDSLENFGKAGFSLAQAKMLVNKIAPGTAAGRRRRAIISTLSWSDVNNLGSLACAVASSQLASFLSSVDTVCSLSKEDCYTDAQKSSYITMLKTTSDVSKWSTDLLSCVGNWATALSASDITSLSTSTFRTAANSLGALSYPSPSLRIVLGDAARRAYGSAISTWSEGTIAALGNITGYLGLDTSSAGCNSDTVQMLTADQIGVIDPSVIPNMHNLRCMTADQLKALDGEQARAVTSAQTSTLSSSQQQALSAASCEPNCQGGSGAAVHTAAMFLVAAAAIFAMLV